MNQTLKPQNLKEILFKQYGPLIGGIELRNILGYKSAASYNRAKRLKLIELHIFKLPARRGWFALTIDVAEWLAKVSQNEVK